jgi:two-component system NarL family response regulator
LLIVDDHPSYVEGLATLMTKLADLQVVAVAYDADTALAKVEAHQPDLVLMDIRLPDRSGIEATREIRARYPSVKVVILTASDEPSDVQEAMREGACGYLLKQSDVGQLAAAVDAIYAGETVVESSLMSALINPQSQPAALDEQEVRLLKLLSRGHELSTIARELCVSESTVKRQTVQVQKKLGAHNRIQAVVEAVKRGLL